jgi:integrase
VKFPQQGLKKKPAILAGDSLAKLLEHVNEPYRTMVSLIAATGLRIGELLARRWSALDLDGGTLAVRESVFEGTFQPPKTQKAVRTIPLGPHAIAALRSHRERVVRRAAADLVFGNRKGNPLRESKLLITVLQPGSGGGRARSGHVASVPPHSLVAAERSQRAGQDRAGAAWARQRFDHTQHLHARRRCIAPQGCRGRRRTVVWEDGLFWTEIGGGARKRDAHKSQRSLNLDFGGAARI